MSLETLLEAAKYIEDGGTNTKNETNIASSTIKFHNEFASSDAKDVSTYSQVPSSK